MRLLPLLLATALLGACAQLPWQTEGEAPPQIGRKLAVVPLHDATAEETLARETRQSLAAARGRERAALRAAPGTRDRDRLLQQAETAAREGNNPRAQSLARQAGARADATLEAARTREAAALLKTLYDTTGLSDAQLASLRAAETALVRGENAKAVAQLRALQSSAKAPRDYRVQRGDTLSAIAAREGVYGNSLLWPLLWEANRERIPDPHRLKAGMTLTIRPSPTVAQVVEAIRTARQYPARVRIGTVKTLPKP